MQRKTLALWALLATLAGAALAADMGTAFIYQGRLCDGGAPANGYYDFTFKLYDAAVGGTHLSAPDGAERTFVPVANGLFTTNVDFGIAPFAGDARWVEISARTNGVGLYVPLGPRQELQPTPYALYAKAAATAGTATTATTASAAPWGGLTGIPTGFADGVDNDTTYAAGPGLKLPSGSTRFEVNFDGSGLAPEVARKDHVHPSGPGSGLDADTVDGAHGSAFWQLRGNSIVSGDFLGTVNNLPLVIQVNSVPGFRLDPTSAGLPNLRGGANQTIVGSAAATIAGGTFNVISNNNAATISGGHYNTIQSAPVVGTLNSASTIGGGYSNTIEYDTEDATIGGGHFNLIRTGGNRATVGGGWGNETQAGSSTIGGGYGNSIQDDSGGAVIAGGVGNEVHRGAWDAAIGGGANNDIGADSIHSFVGGGTGNAIGTNADSSVIGGGYDNEIAPNAVHSFIGGGGENVIQTNAETSVIVGGIRNSIGTASDYSVIGGGYGNDIRPNTTYASIVAGYNSLISTNADFSFVGGGRNNMVREDAAYSSVGGGYYNDVGTNADYATIPGGKQAKAVDYGQFAYSSGQFAAPGDAQASMFVLRRTTTSATPVPLYLDGSSRQITVRTNSTVAFDILVVGRNIPGGDFWEAVSVGYQLRGVVESEGSGVVVRYVSKTWAYDTEAPALDATVETDAAGHLRVMVTGAAYQIRWVAHVRTVEVLNP